MPCLQYYKYCYTLTVNDFDYADGKSHAYRYNSSGALIQDLNRGLKSVTYDNLNRPVKLTFSSASYIDHVYAVDGTRLRTIHNTSLLTGTVVPIQRAPILRPLFTRDTVEYSGPVVYENGRVKRVMFEGGYATFDASGVPGWHYFVCDHAGSVRTVVDMWARAEQINHYYPYGLTFADAGKAPDHQPCKFGGKELDAMYGLHFHDFHARLQIPDLGRFDRPDPLADKYPHLSPYLFCANDPVNNTDPSGMDIVTYGDDDEKYWYRQLSDKTYGFVNSAGELYSGGSEKIEEISLGLQSLQSGEVGNALVESLISNKNELCIEFSTEKNDGNSFSESGSIKWNPYDIFCGLSMDANGEYTPFAPSFISLGHELAHAEDFFSGNMDYSTWYSYNGKSVEYNELKACHVENMIRSEHNIPLRTHYSRTQFDNPVEKSRVIIFPNFSLYFGKTPNFLNFKF